MARTFSGSPRLPSPHLSPSHSRVPSRSHSPTKPLLYDPPVPLLSRIRRRPRTALLVLLIAAALLATHVWRDSLVLLRFKLRDRAYERGWVACGLRKRPLVFVRAEDEVAVVWESNCPSPFELEWGVRSPTPSGWGRKRQAVEWELAEVRPTKMKDKTDTHYAHAATLKSLRPDTQYAYRIALAPQRGGRRTKRALAEHSFPWRMTRPASGSKAEATIHIAAVADNQFNVRTFHRVLLSLLRHGQTRHGLRSPPLLLHAGDQVQNPHNLAQWQTDFWDPLTSALGRPFGQTTPILLARGNHDWDRSGRNTYTGGSPPRTDWLEHRGREGRTNDPGTYLAYSPHERVRVLVLDSNLGEHDQVEQEDWLTWQLSRPEWTDASLRLVVVHVAPFLEFWDTRAWTEGKESQWLVPPARCLPLATTADAFLPPGHSTSATASPLSYPSTTPLLSSPATNTPTLAASSPPRCTAASPRPTRPRPCPRSPRPPPRNAPGRNALGAGRGLGEWMGRCMRFSGGLAGRWIGTGSRTGGSMRGA